MGDPPSGMAPVGADQVTSVEVIDDAAAEAVTRAKLVGWLGLPAGVALFGVMVTGP